MTAAAATTPVLGSGLDSLARISWREISRTSSSVSHGASTRGAGLVAGAAGGRAGARVGGRAAGARAVPAVAGERHPDQVGVVGAQLGLAQRRAARRTPGRELWTTTSARAGELAGDAPALRLLEVDADRRPCPAVVLAAGVPPATRWRYGSPSSGSTLITRAPRSASIDVAIGAAMIVANSTTVMPSSGRAGGGAGPGRRRRRRSVAAP